ncbi:hypothetical protein MKX01_017796 [Papaver californicum]|nr:hypothetical protein MKX01_017796 [Papaver californicum]
MLSSKPKSDVAPPNKISAATPKISKVGRGVSKPDSGSPSPVANSRLGTPSPVHNSRLSIERSPKTAESKTPTDRRSPRVTSTTPTDKQPPRAVKGSELQAQLNQAKEDLTKTKEKLALIEKEKDQALEELKEAKRIAEEADAKLGESIVAQKRAEENTEIEKFRADELEQVGIETSQKKEEAWTKELEAVQNQHAVDVASLLSTTQELQTIKQELAMTADAKNQALSHAEDATKIAEIHAEKVEVLTAELGKLKALLDVKVERESNETSELVKKLDIEVDSLKEEVKKSKAAVAKLTETEELVEHLQQELKKSKAAEVTLATESEELIGQLRLEVDCLKIEISKSKSDASKLVENEILIENARVEVDSLKKELEKLKSVEEKLAEREVLVEHLRIDMDSLKEDLEVSKSKEATMKAKLAEGEALIKKLRVDVETAKQAELHAINLVEEMKKKSQDLEIRVEEANRSEKSASESLDSLMQQLEGKIGLLQDAETDVESLKEQVGSLEISIARAREDLDESEKRYNTVKKEYSEMAKTIEFLNADLETVKEEKMLALNHEKLAASSVQNLLEEKNELINKLEASRDDEDKSKKAMESLASALHEVSAEAREAKEKLLITESDLKTAEAEIEDLQMVLKETNEKYENRLDVSRNEIDLLSNTIHQSKLEIENSNSVWDEKEKSFVTSIKQLEEETLCVRKETERLVSLLKEAEEEARVAKKDGIQMQINLEEAESEVSSLRGLAEEVKVESIILKDRLLDKENELQSIMHENEELRVKEANAREKVEELSKFLEEVTAKKNTEENGDVSDSEKDYDLLPKVVEFTVENGNTAEKENSMLQTPSQNVEEHKKDDLLENLRIGNGNHKEKEDNTVEVEPKMWENFKIGEKDYLPEKGTEHESVDDDLESKMDDESLDQVNGLSSTESIENGATSPTKQLQQKKKKPLLSKFGSLLKKKSSTNSK